ncbi:MFS general substrate transporter [Hortaea werneckii]|uniref:Major facilitator superfamily (MFS) profile domain-containing protein n=1 Tax=Hortaea werneckii TaxID=91943 RepID=A0A3M7FRF0_HORWE|nr:MFS general substrate transporter [Hortaea werneckii]KAI6871796.1 MFS general substrate transporter [Hortaea werneckii]KAI7345154.1 MFS general substrate transporter [Hortaea werneckii]KAI7568046.1 MFS general substrate transporter [Hortaea werneckii]KAI7618885.1 MFS general substrate transporter [Hortaea werneckii]
MPEHKPGGHDYATDDKVVVDAANDAAQEDLTKGTHENDESLRDVSAHLFLEIRNYAPEELHAERPTVRRKLDWIIIPMICITYCLQSLDKLSLNYASAYSLIPDLGLEGHRYSWVAAIFNFGYLFWAIPANLMIQRLPIGKYTGTMVFLWSVVLCCHAAAENYAGILVLRFILGMFEANISPCIMNIVSTFYARSEQPLRMCIFLGFNGVSTMVGALLGYGLGHVDNAAIPSWKLIFLVIGLMNFVWSFVILIFMPDSANNARFLNHKQKVIAIDRVSANMVGVKTKQYKPSQMKEALLDVKVWALTLIALAVGVVNGGYSNFQTSLIKGYGFSGIMATLLQLPAGAIEFVTVPVCGLFATYVKDVRCLTMMVACLAPLGGLLGIRLTSLDHRWSLVGCSWLLGILGVPIILTWNILQSDIGGHTKRTITNGLWFTFYAAGNIVGSNIFDNREAPRYFSALTGLIVCYCGVIALTGFLWLYMWVENKRRDAMLGGEETVRDAEEQAILEGFKDKTDKESKGFRYSL